MDGQLARRSGAFADLLDQFVCVRLVQCYGLDRELFQFDPSLTMVSFFMNADGDLYGRYGTRAGKDDAEHVSAAGLRAAMTGALVLHKMWREDRAQMREKLSAKKHNDSPWSRYEDIPIMKGRVAPASEGKKECYHCHWVQGGEILSRRAAAKPIDDRQLWMYPMLDVLGAALDPEQRATIARVLPHTPAAKAGWRAGDQILEMEGQPILSIADVQWVLHRAGDTGKLDITVRRGRRKHQTELELPHGWRRKGDISWRPIVWMLRDEALGFHMEPMTDREKERHHVDVRHTVYYINRIAPPWYKQANQAARKAGLRKGDILIAIDDRPPPATMSRFLAWIAQETRPGQEIRVTVLRNGRKLTIAYPLK